MDFTSSTGNDGVGDYTYDDTGQLTDVDHDFQTDETYSFDENGNRTLTGYTTGSDNRMTSDGTFNYTYDDEGNRLERSRIATDPADDYTTDYEWDHRNRLTKITDRDKNDTITKEIDYTYDVLSRRITKSVDLDGAGAGSAVVTQYIYDLDHIALALDGNDDITNRYLHGPAIDMILADEHVTSTSSDGDVLWPLTDHLGSVRDILESDGTVANHLTYDAFGNITSETDDTVDHIFTFTGRERDEESDLQYNRARYYDAAVGAWISNDPLGFAAGDTNFSRYVFNSPVNKADPLGLYADPPQSGDGGTQPENNEAQIEMLTEASDEISDILGNIGGSLGLNQWGLPELTPAGSFPCAGSNACVGGTHRIPPGNKARPPRSNEFGHGHLATMGQHVLGLLWWSGSTLTGTHPMAGVDAAGADFPGTIAYDATAFGAQYYRWPEDGSEYEDTDESEAARHMYWVAMMTFEYGAEQALAYAEMHELGLNGTNDSLRDHWHNQAGVDLGLYALGVGYDPQYAGAYLQILIETRIEFGEYVGGQNGPRLPLTR